MKEILSIDVINNNKGRHEDLLFFIPDLIGPVSFDSYYFCLATESANTIDEIKEAVSQLIQFWVDKVSEIENEETIYLPIDFSDQHTGCLRVKNESGQLVLTYGFSGREGWAVDPLNPEDYYKEISDFVAGSEKQVSIDQPAFISALDRQIKKIKK